MAGLCRSRLTTIRHGLPDQVRLTTHESRVRAPAVGLSRTCDTVIAHFLPPAPSGDSSAQGKLLRCCDVALRDLLGVEHFSGVGHVVPVRFRLLSPSIGIRGVLRRLRPRLSIRAVDGKGAHSTLAQSAFSPAKGGAPHWTCPQSYPPTTGDTYRQDCPSNTCRMPILRRVHRQAGKHHLSR